MKRVNSREVVLTDREVLVKQRFEEYLRDGHGIPAAARMALNVTNVRDRDFVDYLSDGTCDVFKGRVRVKPQFRTLRSSSDLTADEMRRMLGIEVS